MLPSDPDDQNKDKKNSQQLLLLILLLLIALFVYLYLFTGLIKPRGEAAKPQPAQESQVKKPLPPREGNERAVVQHQATTSKGKKGAEQGAKEPKKEEHPPSAPAVKGKPAPAGEKKGAAPAAAKPAEVASATEPKKNAASSAALAKPARPRDGIFAMPPRPSAQGREGAGEEKKKPQSPAATEKAPEKKRAEVPPARQAPEKKEAAVEAKRKAGVTAGAQTPEGKRKADAEAKQKAEAENKRKAEAKQKAEAENKRTAEAETRRKAQADAKRKAEAEARRKAEGKQKAEAETKGKAAGEKRKLAGESKPKVAAREGGYTLELSNDLAESEMGHVSAKLKQAGISSLRKAKVKKVERMHRLYLADFGNHAEAQEELDRLRQVAPDAFMLKEQGRYTVYAGSYMREGKAATEQDRLYEKGVKLLLRPATAQVTVLRVQAGSFSDEAAAEKAARTLKKAGVDAKVVKPAR